MSKLEQQKEHFESIAGKYFKTRQDAKHQLVKDIAWRTFFSKLHLEFEEKPYILEGMCGAGDGYEILSKYIQEFNYSAFDYSEKMVEFAKDKFPHQNIYCADITKLEDVEKYDIIIIIGGLHHVYQYKEIAINNICQALKPNGFFICHEPTHNNWFFKKVREIIYKRNTFFDEETEQAFTTNELNSLMRNAGLELVEQTFPGLLAYVFWYNPDAFPILNKGSNSLVKAITNLESKIYHTAFAKYFSFITISCYQKK